MTPLLQQAREALKRAQINLPSFQYPTTSREIAAALASLDAYEAMSEYDKAVEALAPYLPDGWVVQVKSGASCHFLNRPTCKPYYDGGMGTWICGGGVSPTDIRLRIPVCEDWETSSREIRAGRVVPQGEGGRG